MFQVLIMSIGRAKAIAIRNIVFSALKFTSVLITALLTFLITAAVVYFVFVLPMNTFNERRGVVAAQTDSEVLAEIRDLLKTNRGL